MKTLHLTMKILLNQKKEMKAQTGEIDKKSNMHFLHITNTAEELNEDLNCSILEQFQLSQILRQFKKIYYQKGTLLFRQLV